MKRLLVIIPFLFLLGCDQDVPVKPIWPSIPEELKTACPDLKQVDPNTAKLSQVVDVVVDNYSQYHECQDKADFWMEWYQKQKKIYEGVK
jgi:hypothetical protein